tara:strand:+ start:11937 stop:13418 length:1482 start_codon:yes stop_codon:yes gene_type:complete
MKYYLFSFLYLFLSCASQSAPSGGPIDSTGPIILNVSPNKQSLLSEEEKIVIFFDESINPISVVNAIEIFPKTAFSYRVMGKKIIITPNDEWNNSNIIKVKLSRKISDYQNNLMSSPIELFYFNSSEVSYKTINGHIVNANNQLFELGLYKIDDSGYNLIEKTQSNDSNYFEFKYLNQGNYYVAAIADSLINIGDDIRRRRYGMITDSLINLITNDTIYTAIKVDLPLGRLSIQSFDQINNSFGYIMYNNGEKEPFIISESDDSLLIKKKLRNRLESYDVNYLTDLSNIVDTINPDIKSFSVSNNIAQLVLSEPIQDLIDSTGLKIFYIKDSMSYNIDYEFINQFTLNFQAQDQSINQFFITNITDLYNNINTDTLSLLNQPDNFFNNQIEGGNVYGSIIYNGIWPIIIKAQNTESEINYYATTYNKNEFSFINIQPGFYEFSAFEFFGDYDSTQYFSGLWNPFHRASKFEIYPQTLEIRKHWDIKDMILEIK